MFQKIILLILLVSCTHNRPSPIKEGSGYASGEIILSSMLLINIHDGVMPPLECVGGQKDAEILLRVIRPRMEEIDARLDKQLNASQTRLSTLKNCLGNCSCHYLEQTIRDSKLALTKNEKSEWSQILKEYKSEREAQCLSYIQQSFCGSPLQLELDNEKGDFISTEE